MKCRIVRWFAITIAVAAIFAGRFAPNATAQDKADKQDEQAPREEQDSEEIQECTGHLKLIYDAIQAYRTDHKKLPDWLSDLVPQYLPDANILVCPSAKRTGRSETPGLADPKMACSYLFEFSPEPLGKALTNNPTIQRREWKQRQMGLVGSVVPIVRCRQHKQVLNLAYDGKIYESPMSWEKLLTNRINIAELTPAHIFAKDPPRNGGAPTPAPHPLKFDPRDPKAKPELIDLTHYYTAMLTDSWHGSTNNTLSSLPKGIQNFAGTDFDVRGIVQLNGKAATPKYFPKQINGIKVKRKCQRLEFLHAAGFGNPNEEGKQVGTYVIHYAVNQMRLEVPIVYGRDVRDWHEITEEKPGPKELTIAWQGENPSSKAKHLSIRLFKTTWTNVAPDVEIESIDFVSSMLAPGPFLVALTAE